MFGMELDGANEFSMVGSMLHGKQLSDYQIQKRKFLYIEGLIRFLELYGQNEIGNVEVDMQKVALWVNSPAFENVDVYEITSISKVYKMLTADIIDRNVPLYRFLKLSDYQLRVFETEHRETLLADFKEDCEKYPCLKCVWYEVSQTSFGTYSKCHFPKDDVEGRFDSGREGYHDITLKKHRNCKYLTTIDNTEFIADKFIRNNEYVYRPESVLEHMEKYKKEWLDKLNHLDNSYIPITLPDSFKTLLSEEEDVWKDFGRAFNSKKTRREMKKNLRFALLLEAMIKFVEIYAQTEMGSDYIADIAQIARYVNNRSNEKDLKFTSEKEIYDLIEDHITDDEGFIRKFVKRKEV